MKILSTWVIHYGHGHCASVELDCDPPRSGEDEVVRPSDGARWRIAGVEFFLHRPPRKGDRVGLLLRGDAAFHVGDEIEFAPHSSTAAV
jgi:hypothetical protein